ncbi:RING finger protein 17 [Lampris incognitus]|uniref:RING finger protein 17 n=1 Tax=Lampris incognitus TaxID=2546036 RepID=UPI0024B6127C|nr:RING finger protein 17 [Lampris incognitus]
MAANNNTTNVLCKLCGLAYTLPDDEVSGNLPHVLLCGHIYCSACLESLEFAKVILCPECKVESTLSEGGVYGLQEDSRIIGLIYMAKMKRDETPQRGLLLGENVVLSLVAPCLEKGRNITTDNFFMSLEAGQHLTEKEDQPRWHPGEKEAWAEVKVLSRTTITPKYGVDILHQMVHMYSVKSGTCRWPVPVFYNILALAGINVHILYKECTDANITQRNFLLLLGEEFESRVYEGEVCPRSQSAAEDHSTAADINTEAVPGVDIMESAIDEALAQAAENLAQLEHIQQSADVDNMESGVDEDQAAKNLAQLEHIQQSADVDSMESAVDEALAQAAENLAQLEHIQQTLLKGLEAQVNREKSRLLMELSSAVDRATQILHKRREALLSVVTNIEVHFSFSQMEVFRIQKRMKDLEIAMQKARQLRCFPSLERYCNLDELLETLKTPLDNLSFDMSCVTLGSGLSLSEEPPPGLQHQEPFLHGRTRPGQVRRGSSTLPCHKKASIPQQQDQDSQRWQISPQRPFPSSSLTHQATAPELEAPDVIIEEVIQEEQEQAFPFTGPQLASGRRFKRRKNIDTPITKEKDFTPRLPLHLSSSLILQPLIPVSELVLVTHVVNPSHFYIHYVAGKREGMKLFKKINHLCSGDGSRFSLDDTLETGSMVLVKKEEEWWCRASVTELFQKGCQEAVAVCPISLLAYCHVFFLDYGFTWSIIPQSKEETTESLMEGVNERLRKAELSELRCIAPQAIKCCLKDIVPANQTTGWDKKAQIEFRHVIGSSAVEMQVLGQEKDYLLVDLKKALMDCASNMPVSIREYLVLIEVARFYSPVICDRKPLLFYPPVYPLVNIELNAVVTHINSPSDFYIQLVDDMEFMLLTEKMQDYYSSASADMDDDNLRLYHPTLEQACVAPFDKAWYRAMITSFPGVRKVEVQYMDFGNKQILSFRDLRKIKDEFFDLPAKAIRCCLSDLSLQQGETWSDSCTDRFISLAHQKLVIVVATEMVPKTVPQPVRLYESSFDGPMNNIADLLVTEKLDCFEERNAMPPIEEPPVWDPPFENLFLTANGECFTDDSASGPSPPMDQGAELMEFQPKLWLPASLNKLQVQVTHVNSPSSFFVQLIQNDHQLKRIWELLKQEYGTTKPQKIEWEADMPCAALINGVWERGQICTNDTSNNIAEVVRYDFGSKAKLHISNLRPLQPTLVGSLALECTLSDIRPAGGCSTWTATACDFISSHLTGASAVMSIKEPTDMGPIPVSLICSNRAGQDVSMADLLVNEGLALKQRKPRETALPKPEKIVKESQPDGSEKDGTETDGKHTPPDPPLPTPPPVAPSATPPTASLASPLVAPAADCPASSSLPIPSVFDSNLLSAPESAHCAHLSTEKVRTQFYPPPALPCHGLQQMTITAIGDDSLIYARTHYAGCQLEQLKQQINYDMKTFLRQKHYTWKSVQGCAVNGTDMLWHRGQVLEVHGEQIKVFYVDYGLVENIPVAHAYPMLLYEDVPQLCIPCKLQGVIPVGNVWQQDAVDLLRELLLTRSVDVEVLELPKHPRGCLTVQIYLDGLTLSRILCHQQHAFVDPTAPEQEHRGMCSDLFLDDWDIDTEGLKLPDSPRLGTFTYSALPEEGEHFPVRVKHLWTPNDLFLWALDGSAAAEVKVGGETLVEALARVTANIDSLPPLSNFYFEAPCLAEYIDGKYYRAKVMDFSIRDPVLIIVQHVDFGSNDSLPISKLRQMPAELLLFPAKALKVHAAGFKAPRDPPKKYVLPYCPQWSMKAVKLMSELLHQNVTALVLTRTPDLTVVLYDEKGDLLHLPLVASGLAELD